MKSGDAFLNFLLLCIVPTTQLGKKSTLNATKGHICIYVSTHSPIGARFPIVDLVNTSLSTSFAESHIRKIHPHLVLHNLNLFCTFQAM